MILENNYKRHNVEIRNYIKIFFEKPERIEKEYYGINGIKKWIKCFSIEMLPYNLIIYESEPIKVKRKDTNKKTNKKKKNKNIKINKTEILDEDKDTDELEIFEFITCQDSIFFDKNIDHKNELEWRQSLILGDDIDFWSDIEGKWINAKIGEIRNDVIEGVFKIMRRKSLELLGFVYFESKNIAKSGTHTKQLSQEDLNQEIKLEKKQLRQNKNFIEMREQQIDKKLKKLKTFYSEDLQEFNGIIKDTLPLYFNLKFTEPFTREEIYELNKNILDKDEVKQTIKNASLPFLSLVKINSSKGYEGNYYDALKFVDINKFNLENIPLGYNYDGYYNIQIKADDGFILSDLIKTDVILIIGEVSINGIFNHEKNIIEFVDFTENNPLFQLSTQKYYIICSEFYKGIPITCSYTAIKLNTFYRALLTKNYFISNRVIRDNKKYIIFSNIIKTYEIEEEKLGLN